MGLPLATTVYDFLRHANSNGASVDSLTAMTMIQAVCNRFAAISMLVFLQSACQSLSIRRDVALPNDDVASVILRSMKVKYGETLVYGQLTIENRSNPIVEANLDCLKLQYKDEMTHDTAVDSYNSIDNSAFSARNGRISVNVFWEFSRPIEGGLSDLNLVYNLDHVLTYHCVTHLR